MFSMLRKSTAVSKRPPEWIVPIRTDIVILQANAIIITVTSINIIVLYYSTLYCTIVPNTFYIHL